MDFAGFDWTLHGPRSLARSRRNFTALRGNFTPTSHQLHANFTPTSHELHATSHARHETSIFSCSASAAVFLQFWARFSSCPQDFGIPVGEHGACIKTSKMSLAGSKNRIFWPLRGALAAPSQTSRVLHAHFTATSRQLHTNFAATSRELHTNFTQLHKLHIASHSLSR